MTSAEGVSIQCHVDVRMIKNAFESPLVKILSMVFDPDDFPPTFLPTSRAKQGEGEGSAGGKLTSKSSN